MSNNLTKSLTHLPFIWHQANKKMQPCIVWSLRSTINCDFLTQAEYLMTAIKKDNTDNTATLNPQYMGH